MAWVCIDCMFRKDLVVCREQSPERRLLSLGSPLGAGNNLIEETNI